MIGLPPKWTRRVDGARVVLVPPGGLVQGAIRYTERCAPVRSPAEILDAQLAITQAFEVARIAPWERLVTIEGEHAVATTVHGSVAGEPVQRDVGIVFLDDAYALVEGYCLAAAAFATFTTVVRELVRGDRHFLGVRRRRIEYAPPAGWHEEPHGSLTAWRAPDRAASILVWPALPSAALTAAELVARARAEAPGTTTLAETDLHALPGLVVASTGARVTQLVALQDDRYTYAARLDAPDHAHDELFAALVRSIRPVPPAARDAPRALADVWAE